MSHQLIFPPNDMLVAYCDEVGRGSLISDVVVGCVILPNEFEDDDTMVGKIKDSKKCTPKLLVELDEYIKNVAVAWGIGKASVDEIDKMNILNATMLAMHRALDQVYLQVPFDKIMVDGDKFKPYLTPEDAQFVPHQCIVNGDSQYLGIAAASIIAKVHRDQFIQELALKYADFESRYGWSSNKGYGTRKHIDGLLRYGPTEFHRKSFKFAR